MKLEQEIRDAVERQYSFSAESWRAFATDLLAEVDRTRAESAEVARVHQEMVAVAAESLGVVKAELDALRVKVERFEQFLLGHELEDTMIRQGAFRGTTTTVTQVIDYGRELGLFDE